jgi:hemoglobin
MVEKEDLRTLDQVKAIVDLFYEKVRKDDLIGPVFEHRINGNWEKHLDKMYRFWQTVLLEEHTYYGSPFAPHANLPVEKVHFDRWLWLFHETLKENFSGDKASEALWRATKMAEMFRLKISYFKHRNNTPPG